MNLEKKLYELGYTKGCCTNCFKKRFECCFIVIFINEDNTLDFEHSGVQRNGLNNFCKVEEIHELWDIYCIFKNDLYKICKEL